MKDTETIILEPNEYKTGSDLKPFGGHFLQSKAIMITRDNENTVIPTALNVDPGCRIQVTRRGTGFARVKHLTSTPRRNYYMFIMWFSIFLGVIGWIFTLFEIFVNGNYATGDSRTNLAMLPAFVAWLGLNIPVLRNGRGFTKWFSTVFGYFVLFICVVSLVRYFVRLIQGY